MASLPINGGHIAASTLLATVPPVLCGCNDYIIRLLMVHFLRQCKMLASGIRRFLMLPIGA